MHIGVFYQADDRAFAGQVLNAFKARQLSGTGYQLGPGWEGLDGQEISFNFCRISHYVIIPHAGSFRSRWLPFIAGFGLGGAKSVCVLFRDKQSSLPRYLGAAQVFREVERLVAYLHDEQDIWHKGDQIERSREHLISLGLGINEENLAARAAMGDDESVEHFLHIGYSPDTANAQGVPLICLASRNGHRTTVELLLSKRAEVNVLSQDRGNSPLMEAAVRGDELSVRHFLEAGADPNLVSKAGQTAIMLAIGEGHTEIVLMLLRYKADVDIKDSLGMTARKYAEIFQHKEILAAIDARAAG